MNREDDEFARSPYNYNHNYPGPSQYAGFHRLNIQRHFLTQPSRVSRRTGRNGNVHSGLSNPSLFNPPGIMAPSIIVFRSLVLQDLDKLPNKIIHTNPAITGLKSLCERKNLIIHPTDKGGGIVILDKEEYTREMNRILEDRMTYGLLPIDPTLGFKRTLIELVNEGSALGILDKKETEFLIPLAPRIPIFYYLPKVHKNPVNPPGRPIVNGIDSVTSRMGRYIDFHLQPLS